MDWTIGADPELFLTDKYNKYKSAVNLIGGNKWNPKPIDDLGNAILEDNVAVEFNIQPSTTLEEFKFNINKVLNHLKNILPEYNFSTESAVLFPEEELNTPEAHVFGCEPDFNAWTLKQNPKPYSKYETLRSAGGHIHIGSPIAQQYPIQTIRAMDLYLGVPSISLDSSQMRRELYGQAGSFRLKPYGVEYRTLSNFWIYSSNLIEWVYNQTQKALKFVEDGSVISKWDKYLIKKCINESCLKSQEKLIFKFNL
jgi:hypothetical protein